MLNHRIFQYLVFLMHHLHQVAAIEVQRFLQNAVGLGNGKLVDLGMFRVHREILHVLRYIPGSVFSNVSLEFGVFLF